jgi:hypothetical protein
LREREEASRQAGRKGWADRGRRNGQRLKWGPSERERERDFEPSLGTWLTNKCLWYFPKGHLVFFFLGDLKSQ